MGLPISKFNFPPKQGHWYDFNGVPHHSIPMASNPERTRATTLKDARKFNWYPSVSAFADMLKNDGLIRWSDEIILSQVFQYPRVEGESFESYKARIIEKVDYLKNIAPNKGTAIHKALEEYFTTGAINKEYAEHIVSVETLLKTEGIEVLECESPLIPKFCGYGGRVDCVGGYNLDELIVLDFKTQETKGGKFRHYIRNTIQLCGYKEGLALERGGAFKQAEIANVYVSSDEPSKAELRKIPGEEVERGTSLFYLLKRAWCELNDYSPIHNGQNVKE